MAQRLLVALISVALAGTALAHEGVRNPAVMERMNNMVALADEMEILVNMARGTTAFDASLAEAALDRFSMHSSSVVGLFETRETDPRMEALPAIWEDFADFTAKADDMERTARELSGSLAAREDVVAAVTALGATCTGCHDVYRLAD